MYGLARIEMGHVGVLVIRSIRAKEFNPGNPGQVMRLRTAAVREVQKGGER